MARLAEAEKQISLAVRARCPIIYLVTWEEERAAQVLDPERLF